MDFVGEKEGNGMNDLARAALLSNAKKGEIKDLEVQNLKVNGDDRGYLFEVLRKDNPKFAEFGQVYVVHNKKAYVTRAFHAHNKLVDYFCIVKGSAKFAFVDARNGSPTYGHLKEVIIGDKSPQLIVVPPGVFHGWMGLEDDTILCSVGSELYNKENPDEHRVPPNSFGYVWKVEAK